MDTSLSAYYYLKRLYPVPPPNDHLRDNRKGRLWDC
jgi:hypothetical protein